MKRIAVFIVFILLLAQASSVAHAIADSFHSDEGLNIINTEFTDTNSTNNYDYSDNANCSEKCHGHSHFYMNTSLVKPLFIQKINLKNKLNENFKGFILEPESPPPNFI